MAAIVYNTRFDPSYRNAEAKIAAPAAEKTDLVKTEGINPVISPKSNMEKYFFMAVIGIGLGVVIYKSMKN